MRNGYLLIDGNNMAYRALHAYDIEMKTTTGIPTSVIYGVLSQLAYVRSAYQGFMPLVVWDGGYTERTAISKKAQSEGIIPSAYKENRHDPTFDGAKMVFDDQVPKVQKMISLTNIPQIRLSGEEADDVIASYCRKLTVTGKKILCFTGDHDYYQLITDNVIIVARNRGVDTLTNMTKFVEKYGIQPHQWVDIGALQGDNGDNIFGVPGVGESTAINLVAEHGTYEGVINASVEQMGVLRLEYPDLESAEEIENLVSTRADKKVNPYSGCYPGMPFTGIAMALEQKKLKRVKRAPLYIAMYQERVRIAYVLKKMRDELPVPELVPFNRYDAEGFSAACDMYELNEIRSQINWFVDLKDEPI